jgi:hypothetical protein
MPDLFAEQVYDLAMFSQRSFDKDRMEAFLTSSNKSLEKLGASWGLSLRWHATESSCRSPSDFTAENVKKHIPSKEQREAFSANGIIRDPTTKHAR